MRSLTTSAAGCVLALGLAAPAAAQPFSPSAFALDTAPAAVPPPCLDTSTSAPVQRGSMRTTTSGFTTGQVSTRTSALKANTAPICSSPRPASETTPPARSSGCFVDFSDEDALWILNGAPDSFAQFYSEQCDGENWFSVWPLNYGHFHLSYENEGGVECYVTPDLCQIPDFDPFTQPRYVSSHDGTQYWLMARQQGDGTELPFGINSLRVMDSAVRLCYRPEQEYDPSEWEAGSSGGVGGTPGVWYCWNDLQPGLWDLSEWVQNVTEVKVTGTSLAFFSIDDVDVTTP